MDELKKCRGCGLEKPLSDFRNESGGRGLKARCNKCLYDQSQAYHRAHPEIRRLRYSRRMSDPSIRAVYNARKLAYYKRVNGDFKKGERIKLRHAPHRKLREDEKRSRMEQRVLNYYGQEMLQLFLQKPFQIFSSGGWKLLRQLKLEIIGKKLKFKPSHGFVERVEQLNRACGLPLMNVGWHCYACGLVHADPRFFDLDHAMPRHKGGRTTWNNLQCLCPNCHRKKTLAIENFRTDQMFKGNGELQLQAI